MIILGYIALNTVINQLHISYTVLFNLPLHILIPHLLFNILLPILVALNINLIVFKFQEMKRLQAHSGIAAVGAFGGLLAGACPGCFVGLFPAFLGLFGVTATLGNLPFFGVELLAISAILLIISAYYLSKNPVCKIKEVKK
ncbi:hypothetical protein GOV09_01475 [Candidatus Woesearchaeota archaeon]|nr:hypothetical protein [Candidatus Woesearchaeota archaeon]